MKRLSAICIAITAVWAGGQALAQTNSVAPPTGHEGMRGMSPEERFNQMSQALNLNAEQKAKVEATFEETRQKIQVAIEEARSNAETQLQKVLSPEQYQKLQEYWMRPVRPGAPSGANPNPNSGH